MAEPPVWLADLIAAAYRDDTDGIRRALSRMTEAEKRAFGHVLAVITKTMVNERLGHSRAREQVTATVTWEE